ncbi:cytochrome c oxidase subunit 3 [Bisbaumannia pacifica]|uniref:Cytochrome bo(3) ubiquinol oxidase subunit 3 n=1 Tax=Bisbaumannia pacifica TaxID=77098 RepID=A0A510X3F5_9GAMM|nr:cytochrome c oxidase subunit 3 [Halomonas pacifica]MBH8580619.1 cytochrome c oxidase subunit 3 [Halomonas pacifica]GEK45944.1 bb3-type cytochrome oxidase subunit IV [Halomonas pacifica]
MSDSQGSPSRLAGVGRDLVADWAADRRVFAMPWDKAMIWLFILSDVFIFACFLVGYMALRIAATEPWPDAGEVFALHLGGEAVPLLLIAIMTFVLISSSGTMALAVKSAHAGRRGATALLLGVTALLGLTFVGMQAFEWTKLIEEGVRPWGNPWGAAQFGASFFLITGFHGTHVSIGVLFLVIMTIKAWRGSLGERRPGFMTRRRGRYAMVESLGLYWHFVDLVWVFIFAFFYLW